MFIRTRKVLTLTTLISGLLWVSWAQAQTKGAKNGDVTEIDVDQVDGAEATPTPKPAPVKQVPTPKVEAKIPTATPVPAKPVPTNTPSPTKTSTPVKAVPTSTPTAAPPPVEMKAAVPTSTPSPVSTESPVDQGSQFSLSLDAQGQGLLFHKTPNMFFGFGGEAFADWRLIQYLSLGFGGQYTFYPGTGSFSVDSFDLGGRIFPLPIGSTPGGEFYMQGGVGLNLIVKYPVPGHFHGYAGPGYRLFLSKNMALDMGAQYDFYSPIGYVTNGISAKLGITFLFGRTEWPNQVDNSGEDTADSYQKQSPFYKWKAGDTLRGVSARVFGDPLLFSLLVDMNKELFLHPAMIRVGTEFNVKARLLDADEIESYHVKSLNVHFYIELDKASSRFGYTTDPDWKGPTRYIWKKDDTFTSVAEKIYGDEDLFPILVDAN